MEAAAAAVAAVAAVAAAAAAAETITLWHVREGDRPPPPKKKMLSWSRKTFFLGFQKSRREAALRLLTFINPTRLF